MPEIIVKYEEKIVERVVTEKKRISIGRTNENDIVLENRGVSRKHAMIEFNDRAAVVIDNESLNGTFVNNRKITEEVLRDDDTITIGKYSLIYHAESTAQGDDVAIMDGTMVLNTKKQRKLLANDKVERQLISKYGGSILVGEEKVDFAEFALDRDVTTFGKAKFVHIRVKGIFLSGIQAKITKTPEGYTLNNLGRSGKTRLNGEVIDQAFLKNGDLITIGKSTIRFVEGNK